MSSGSPVLGRPSPAATNAAALRDQGGATDAAFRADGGDCEWCALRAVSIAGIRHRLSAQPGQDSFAWARVGDWLAVAVADGLGGVPGSAGAAWRAASSSVAAITAATGSSSARVTAGLEAANQAAAGGGATTVVLAVVERGGQARLARVGDSTAFVVGDGGGPGQELFSGPADDDGVATVTAALPAGDPQPELAMVALGRGEVLVLVTDGVADPWRDGPATVAPALAGALAGRPGPLELAQLLDFSRQGCHDDRTMIAVWLTPGSAGEPGPVDTHLAPV